MSRERGLPPTLEILLSLPVPERKGYRAPGRQAVRQSNPPPPLRPGVLPPRARKTQTTPPAPRHRRQQQLLSFRPRPSRPPPAPPLTTSDGSGCRLRPRIHSTPAIPQQTLAAAAAAAAVGSRAIETAGDLPRRGRGVYITTTKIPGDEEAPIRSGAEGDIEEPLVSRRTETMADQLGFYTIRSHGMILARLHMYDWIILLLLAVIDGLLNLIEPFHRFVGKDMMTDLRYPMKGNTVPFWAVPLIGIILPWAIFVGIYFKKKNFYDLHHGILGILYSVLITAVITDAIKDGVGRPRPDFFWRCFPDGNDVYDNITTGVICNGVKSVIKEGHKSFPSGHSSWSFAGLGFLAWYLAGKIAAFDRKGHVAKLCIVFLPLLTAALVAVSRVDDYWHHWQDVFAGALIGLTVASFCYLQFFPYPFDGDAWWPHAYTVQVAEERNSRHANSYSVRPTEIETVNIPGHGGMTLRDTLNDVESGSGRRL